VVVHPPQPDGGRQVTIRGEPVGTAYHLLDLVELMRLAGLPEADTTIDDHARRMLDVYAFHYNGHRPHQARGQLPPLAQEHPAPSTDLTAHRLLRTRVLGGVINEYRHAA
ncbi:hypothetical protein ABZT42_49900, partial [Streptomyces mirabilis]